MLDLYDSIRSLNARSVVNGNTAEWQRINLDSISILSGTHLSVAPISNNEIIIFGCKENKASVFNTEQKSLKAVKVANQTEGNHFAPSSLRPLVKTKGGELLSFSYKKIDESYHP